MFRSFFMSRQWLHWSILGSLVIIGGTYYEAQIAVWVNKWLRDLYDMFQAHIENPGQVEEKDYYLHLASFAKVAAVYIVIAVSLDFFVSHFVFRWRTAMNNYYMSHWQSLRHIEGAAQRVQEDTMLFAKIVQTLGTYYLKAVMILFSFIPVLRDLSEEITELPLIGQVDHSMVWIAILSAVCGTGLVALAGYRLPGLEFNNQLVEAAYRKELVYGEDREDRAQPETVKELFANVRRNYFRLYLHYLYFNVVKWSYLQGTFVLPYIAIGPTFFAGAVTIGFIRQIVGAYERVSGSFEFLVNSWDRIIELMSIYKRLKAFEASIKDKSGSSTMPPLYTER